MLSFHSSRLKKSRGAAVVEFAVVLPIILLILASLLEFSRVLMLQHTADTAAYEAARAAMVPGANAQEARTTGLKLLEANRLSEASIFVLPEDIREETAMISVTVELPVAENSWLPPFWFTRSVVRSEVTLLCERPPLILLSGIPDLERKLLELGLLGL